jgi:hypothetical protein
LLGFARAGIDSLIALQRETLSRVEVPAFGRKPAASTTAPKGASS